MSETIEIIKARRSVRSFQDKNIPEELMHKIIECACYAPSGMNRQPWRFVVVIDQEVREELRQRSMLYASPYLEKMKDKIPERYEVIKQRFETLHDPIYYNAPIIIFVIGIGEYTEISCALAAQNLMLAAKSLSLGTCWVAFGGLIDNDKNSRKMLGLKDDEHIVAPIIVGYEEGETPLPPRKKTNISWI